VGSLGKKPKSKSSSRNIISNGYKLKKGGQIIQEEGYVIMTDRPKHDKNYLNQGLKAIVVSKNSKSSRNESTRAKTDRGTNIPFNYQFGKIVHT
jgi:hypothetical protein